MMTQHWKNIWYLKIPSIFFVPSELIVYMHSWCILAAWVVQHVNRNIRCFIGGVTGKTIVNEISIVCRFQVYIGKKYPHQIRLAIDGLVLQKLNINSEADFLKHKRQQIEQYIFTDNSFTYLLFRYYEKTAQ